MEQNRKWLDWAVELQALAQAGLFYSKDIYDIERFQRIREIAAEMLVSPTGLPKKQIVDLFCGETGYQTPKLDSRAAVFQDDKILLVQEKNGLWSLPGGWVDVNLSVAENAVKEVKEEAGLDVRAEFVIAVQETDELRCAKQGSAIPGFGCVIVITVPQQDLPVSSAYQLSQIVDQTFLGLDDDDLVHRIGLVENGCQCTFHEFDVRCM